MRSLLFFLATLAAFGETFRPNASELQQTINRAQSGDVIELEAGKTYTGNFVLPPKAGAGFVTIQSSAIASLPGPDQRVKPSDAERMPEIVTPNTEPAIRAASRSHHYKLIGLRIRTSGAGTAERFVGDLVMLGSGAETSSADLPRDIVIDRCYIHAGPREPARRGIALNSGMTEVINSHISGFKLEGQDSQAICGWNGAGPFRIVNNYIEGAGENLMFGGTPYAIPGLVPSNIEIKRNYFHKPDEWHKHDATYTGTPWVIKNILELKIARGVTIEGNVLGNNWDTGPAMVITPGTEGRQPSVVEDVTFQLNIVEHSQAGLFISGEDDLNGKGFKPARRITIRNNLFRDYSHPETEGRFMTSIYTPDDLVIDHNTSLQTGSFLVIGNARATKGFRFTNNIVRHGPFGLIGTSSGTGEASLKAYLSNGLFRGNVIIVAPGQEAHEAEYPDGNQFPYIEQVGFVSDVEGVLALSPRSKIKRGKDGKQAGADYAAVAAATARVVSQSVRR